MRPPSIHGSATESYFAFPSPAASEFFVTEVRGDLSHGAVPPTLRTARENAGFLDDDDLRGVCLRPVTRADLLAEIDALSARYGEDGPLVELVSDPAPYSLAARVIPAGYRRVTIEAGLDEVFAVDPASLAAWLQQRSPAAEQLEDVRFRLLGHAGNRLRIEVTGDATPAREASGYVENPMVPSADVALGVGCEPADQPRLCGYSAGGLTRLCTRCRAVHEAQMELLGTY
jgi:hypothetical protein